ncbi:MAG: cadmium transporter [Actinomycetia bacterium]|jgi:cadmium resistance protein CadD (predicted permease)|nr:cadmium transporter [Actinomycetes bacterium]
MATVKMTSSQPSQWARALTGWPKSGLIPFLLGARGLLKAIHAHATGEQVSAAPAIGLLSVMTLTIANGADNLAVYPPVLRTIGPGPALTTIVVFAAGVALWCLAGYWLSSHKKVINIIERYGHWIVPAVFMTIGVIIVISSGVLNQHFR